MAFQVITNQVLKHLAAAFFFSIAICNPSFADNPYILVDASNGHILAGNKINDRWHPASLTKLMTAYVTFKAIRNGEITEASPVVISAAAAKQPPSRMGYKIGVKLRVDTALKIIIIKSANDVSQALSEAVAGNLGNFVQRMNRQAATLGMTNTHFTNANGLHNKHQVSSARDMALLATHIFREFPEYAYLFEAVGIRTGQKTHYSYNLLLERLPGADGMKTGFVCASGYNMVASSQRKGRRLVAVVLGSPSQTDRAITAAKLLQHVGVKNVSGTIHDAAPRGRKPINMRPVLCTKKARETRYDPAAGQAVIKSKYLHPRKRSNNILAVRTGGTIGVSRAQSDFAGLSIPVPRPSPRKPRNFKLRPFKLVPANGREPATQ